jgi:hypothetical protein
LEVAHATIAVDGDVGRATRLVIASERYIEDMVDNYQEVGVVFRDDVLEIRHYYPWGSKKVPYQSIVGVQRVALSALRGRARIWGTANPGYWANLDTKRPTKKEGLVLDLGKPIKPFITPNDLERVEALLRERAGLDPAGPTTPAPLI